MGNDYLSNSFHSDMRSGNVGCKCVLLKTRQTDKPVSYGHIRTPHWLHLTYCLHAVSLLWCYQLVNTSNTAAEQSQVFFFNLNLIQLLALTSSYSFWGHEHSLIQQSPV